MKVKFAFHYWAGLQPKLQTTSVYIKTINEKFKKPLPKHHLSVLLGFLFLWLIGFSKWSTLHLETLLYSRDENIQVFPINRWRWKYVSYSKLDNAMSKLIWLGTWSNFEGNGIGNLQRALLVSIILWLGDSGAGWINMLIAAHTKNSINWPNSYGTSGNWKCSIGMG